MSLNLSGRHETTLSIFSLCATHFLFSFLSCVMFSSRYKLAKTSSPVIFVLEEKGVFRKRLSIYPLFFFSSLGREGASLELRKDARPRRLFSLRNICFRRRNHRDGACHPFYRGSRSARRFSPPLGKRNPLLFRRFWPGVMCRSGFSCIVCPSFVTMREKKFPASRIAIS